MSSRARGRVLGKGASDDMIVEDQHVEPGRDKYGEGVLHRMNDRFAHDVERGVHEYWDVCDLMEFRQQSEKEGIPLAFHGLQPTRPVCMDHSWHEMPHLRAEQQCPIHVGAFLIVLEVGRAVFMKNGWGEGSIFFTKLYDRIDSILHLRQSRVGQNGPIPQSTRTKFGAPLHPRDDLAFSKFDGNHRQKLFLIRYVSPRQLPK